MTAAATAARLADAAESVPASLTLVVVGGLIEGTALGVLQAVGLRRWLPDLRIGVWVGLTVAIAGIGWALASLPSQLGSTDDTSPALALVIAGAALIGAAMGGALGAAQAHALRSVVPHPWRWVGISALAWTPTMVVIFIGATTPTAQWSTPSVIAVGALTGAAAGAVLGVISGVLSPWLLGQSAVNSAVLGVLGSRSHRLLDRSVVGLRLRGRRTGRTLELPVQYATSGAGFVVYPSNPDHKVWWRNLSAPQEVQVLVGGAWRAARGRVITSDDPAWALGRRAYTERWPRVSVPAGCPLVVISSR